MSCPIGLAMHACAGLVGSCVCLLGITGPLYSAPQGGSSAAVVPLSVSIHAECDVQTTAAEVSATAADSSGTGEVSGIVNFQYRIRTSTSGGGGAIRFRLNGTGLPNGTLTYTVSLARSGANVSGQQKTTASGAAEMVAATFGPDAHTGKTGETGIVSWRLRYAASVQLPPAPVAGLSCTAY